MVIGAVGCTLGIDEECAQSPWLGKRVGAACFSAIAVLCFSLTVGVARARAVTVTSGSTGTEQTFTVPRGVEVLDVVAIGGRGYSFPGGAAGGFGAVASADLPVTAGELLYVEVGGDCTGNGGGYNGGGSTGMFVTSGGGGAGLTRAPFPRWRRHPWHRG